MNNTTKRSAIKRKQTVKFMDRLGVYKNTMIKICKQVQYKSFIDRLEVHINTIVKMSIHHTYTHTHSPTHPYTPTDILL